MKKKTVKVVKKEKEFLVQVTIEKIAEGYVTAKDKKEAKAKALDWDFDDEPETVSEDVKRVDSVEEAEDCEDVDEEED